LLALASTATAPEVMPQTFKRRRNAWLLALLLGPVAPACGDPCRDLSDTICNCMPSRTEQQACRKRVHGLAAQNATHEQKDRQICDDLLQSCTCEALAQGNFAACGLSQD